MNLDEDRWVAALSFVRQLELCRVINWATNDLANLATLHIATLGHANEQNSAIGSICKCTKVIRMYASC
tara:strand:- start:371 stop:577 length:207 start_codon:yes stop_codon:yes gene_type:complete